jgi:isocitrate lyase
MIKNLKAARLAADIADVPLIILARTDANAAKLITNDHDENDKPF